MPHPLLASSSSGSIAVMGVQRVSFKRYVEVGRVILVSKGENQGKLATIVEIVDQNRVCIDIWSREAWHVYPSSVDILDSTCRLS